VPLADDHAGLSAQRKPQGGLGAPQCYERSILCTGQPARSTTQDFADRRRPPACAQGRAPARGRGLGTGIGIYDRGQPPPPSARRACGNRHHAACLGRQHNDARAAGRERAVIGAEGRARLPARVPRAPVAGGRMPDAVPKLSPPVDLGDRTSTAGNCRRAPANRLKGRCQPMTSTDRHLPTSRDSSTQRWTTAIRALRGRSQGSRASARHQRADSVGEHRLPGGLESRASALTTEVRLEGYPGRRYYGGCEFATSPKQLGVSSEMQDVPNARSPNVQGPAFGAPANQ